MSLDAALTAAVLAEVERRVAELRRPELVTQRTVVSVVGMPGRDYLRHVRAGHWPSWADRRLRYSKTADVIAWLQEHPVVPVQDSADAQDRAFARAGLRRVGGGR